MKTKKKIFSILAVVLGLMMIACLAFGLTACGDDDGTVEDSKNVLVAPSNFTIDIDTGEYSFTDNDPNAGYYFIRVYKVMNGVKSSTYTATTSRINGGTTGTKTGTIDLSSLGWGEYSIELVTFAAAGTGYTAPDPVVLTAQYGIGGKLETPELVAFYSGSLVELVIDHYTLGNWYTYQTMPVVRFDFYSDETCTELVFSDEIDTVDLLDTLDAPPMPGVYIWGDDANAFFKPLMNGTEGYVYDAYDYTTDDLPAGTYYVTATALSPASYIENSNTSEAIKIVLTNEEPDADAYTEVHTTNYTEADGGGMPFISTGVDTTRENCGASQTVENRLVTT